MFFIHHLFLMVRKFRCASENVQAEMKTYFWTILYFSLNLNEIAFNTGRMKKLQKGNKKGMLLSFMTC